MGPWPLNLSSVIIWLWCHRCVIPIAKASPYWCPPNAIRSERPTRCPTRRLPMEYRNPFRYYSSAPLDSGGLPRALSLYARKNENFRPRPLVLSCPGAQDRDGHRQRNEVTGKLLTRRPLPLTGLPNSSALFARLTRNCPPFSSL